MERLTFDGNFCDIAQCKEFPCPYNGSCSQREVWEKLKAYEATGLEPEVCVNYKAFEDEAISKGVTFKRIVALMEADSTGAAVQDLRNRICSSSGWCDFLPRNKRLVYQ